MKIRTVSITVAAPRDEVLNFLRDIENAPRWATEFCSSVVRRDGRWFAQTARGELILDIVSDPQTGVLDMWAGPTPEQMSLFPVRVLAFGRGSCVTFTFFQGSGLTDELYEAQYRSLLIEMQGLIKRFGGGELHALLMAQDGSRTDASAALA